MVFTLDLLDQLPSQLTNAGSFLRRVLPHVFRTYHQFGREGIHLHDAIAVIAATHPDIFETTEMAGDVETGGELTTGATVFDRRLSPKWRPNMEVATSIDVLAATDCLLRGLSEAG